jgi:hypothetical protein
MIILATLLLVIYCLYKLLTNSSTFKWLFAIFGWLGMYWALQIYVPSSSTFGIIINNYCLTWAAIIPTALLILALKFIRY